ncbi:MAG: DUF4105 domain-containing protein [Bdellovibrionales bacterium]|nr:DUF4105 domain-containing protein [Bdellovibrionales bacterium]
MKLTSVFLIVIFFQSIIFANTKFEANDHKSNLSHFLEKHQITHLEYLVVEGHTASIESLFGHSALRFIAKDQSTGKKLDLVLSFEGDASKYEGSNKILGGMTGKFPVIANIVSFNEYLKLNVVRIGRGFTRIPLPLNSNIQENFKNQIVSIVKNEKDLGQFYFTSRNCMTLTLDLLKDIGYFINTEALETLNTTPTSSSYHAFAPALLLPFSTLIIEGPSDRINRIEDQLNISLTDTIKCKNFDRYNHYKGKTTCKDKKQTKAKNWSKNTIEKLKTLNSVDLWSLFYTLNPIVNRQNRVAVIHELKNRNTEFNQDIYFNNYPLPETVTQMCTNLECAQNVVETLINLEVIKDLNKSYVRLLHEYNRAKNMIYGRKLLQKPQAKHSLYLLNAMYEKLNNQGDKNVY